MYNAIQKYISRQLNEKQVIKKSIKLGYIFLFLFFLSFSPIFYNIEHNKFIFEVDNETGLVLLALCFVFIINVIGFLRKREDSILLHDALSEYVDKEIAKAVLSKKGEINLNGEKKKVTTFFSDIEGFTNISEAFSPEKLVAFLKEYFSIMSSNIQKHNGYIDKYEGDCIMGLWGAFHGMQKDSYDACLSAIKQQKALKILNIKFRKTIGKEIKVRMGINTGEAVLGNIGVPGKKVEYTAFGDSVNIASRLEGMNKYYGTNICVSENIYNECIDFFDFREVDTVILKGRDTGHRVYELINEIGKSSPQMLSIIKRYEKALYLYYNREYEKAFHIFQKLKNKDPASRVMEKRCKKFIKKPPLKSWDSVWEMEAK